ncbi:FAD-dependent monooxygenase [Actinobacillus equuli subsp. equuli]|uniref:FAD-dependent monooxygenase n=1 Tax=Actinobacillus equuli subsp. equuli TaxID=202947 RepID=A0A9X4G0Q5_ACTEU|nr:FAD-dependent monooxygenase [Actinobacillus equuli]MDE8033697.1 FAD-dependent monooxygenase [Actinobacillus equuli subsp. equuli]MDG4948235.1 FAD-dependent monooxygenase [Actinobacillus equuli subsp. haemolyticus]
MKSADIIIIGGGMVGLALAALLKDTECQIKIIEKNAPTLSDSYSNRVSAINATSEKMLRQIGAFDRIAIERLSPYQQMLVWEKDSFAKIHFDNSQPEIKQLGADQLGFIIENNRIRHALWQQVSQQTNAEIMLASTQTIGINETGAFLTLDNGEMLTAKLVVAADGANSWLRQQANIPLTSKDYQHTALVCNVKTAEPHQAIARQIFAPESILAFLPLADEQHCSIVWSLAPEQADMLVSCDEKQFNQALTIAFDNQLGMVELQSERAIYPLVARYARDFAQNRIALIGDAAHTIHPLAGLGVNLGFADAIMLAQEIQQHLILGHDIGEYRHLRRFERTRKAEAIKLLTAMESLKQLFYGNNPLKKLIRGIGLSAVNQMPQLKKQLIAQAMNV